jgi:hypothetical protein
VGWVSLTLPSYFIPPGLPLAIPTARQLLEFIAEAAAVVAVTVTGPRACCCLERPCFALIDPLGVATSAGGHDARTPSDALELAENVWLRRGGSKGRHWPGRRPGGRQRRRRMGSVRPIGDGKYPHGTGPQRQDAGRGFWCRIEPPPATGWRWPPPPPIR